jgi:adenylate kinase
MDTPSQNDRAAWLRGRIAKCAHLPGTLDRPLRVVLLGAPGVGKGTQAALLSQRYGACHLSTGDLLREAKTQSSREQTLATSSALNFMQHGALVPDTIIWQLVRERSGCFQCPGGFILDGFPRTLAQAGALQHLMEVEGLHLDAVINFELPASEIVARLSGRRTCANCKAVFHITSQPPQFADTCDHCGGVLYHREDDRAEAITVRLQAYERSTAPLIDYYRAKGLLNSVPATGEPEQVCLRTMAALEERRGDRTTEAHNDNTSVAEP